jgi:dTDP-glucose 4,6-dehydratase
MPKSVLVTGACGFIGHHVVEHFIQNTDYNIVILDKLTYASKGYERLRSANLLDNVRVRVFTVDLAQPMSEGLIKEIGAVDIIIHMAANSHVDHSIEYPIECIQNNVMSTVYLLEYARSLNNLEKFFYFSTDEVFGPPINNIGYKEWDRHKPTNPYSGSKSAAEQICISYENTYKTPIMICNVMNVFGERQLYEKFVPLCIKKILNEETIDIHCYPDTQISGSRYYIHARNVAQAILFLLENGTVGDKYNITGEKEVSNLEMAQFIAKVLNKPLKYRLIDTASKRPGHDPNYNLNGDKMQKMGWKMPVNFEESLTKTILWTLQNLEWLE